MRMIFIPNSTILICFSTFCNYGYIKSWQRKYGRMNKRKQNVISEYVDTTNKIDNFKRCKGIVDCSLDSLHTNQCKEEEWVNISGPQLSLSKLILYKTSKERKNIFEELENQITYFSEPELTRVKVFGRWYDLPRKQAAYGNEAVTYTYSGMKIPALPWKKAPILQQILNKIKSVTNVEYNFVLVNRYQDGRDKIGEHKDDEKDLDANAPIASLSFGQERDFVLKHQDLVRKLTKDKLISDVKIMHKIVLKDGMLLLMNAPTNKFWYHSLPPRSINTCPNVRINLTFRKII